MGDHRVRFPARHPPRVVRYELESAHIGWLHETLDRLGTLRLTAFDVGTGSLVSPRQHGTSALVRIGLLKRLESSFVAFRASAVRMLSFFQAFAEAVGSGCYLRTGDIRTRDPLQLSLTELLARPLPRSANAIRLADDVAFDIECLRTCIGRMPPDAGLAKTRALGKLLETLGGDRRVVFTEFTETAEALFRALPPVGCALLHGTRCALPSGTASRRVVLERFAPGARGTGTLPAHESVHTLIATDVLAEGVDLQAARHCISFDLPWNPVRLMQRAGRIDRLGSPHPDVFVWYFMPSTAVEQMLGLMRRLALKTNTIERMIGAEHGGISEVLEDHHSEVDLPPDQRQWRLRLRELLESCDGKSIPTSPPDSRRIPVGLLRVHPERLHALTADVSAQADDARPGVACGTSAVLVMTAWERAETRWVEATMLSRGRAHALDATFVPRLLCSTHEDLSTASKPSEQTERFLLDTFRAVETSRLATPSPVRITAEAAAAVRAALVGDAMADAVVCRMADRILRQLRAGLPAGRAAALERLLRRRHELDGRMLIRAVARIAMAGRPALRTRRLIGMLAITAAGTGPSEPPNVVGPSG